MQKETNYFVFEIELCDIEIDSEMEESNEHPLLAWIDGKIEIIK